MRTLFTFILIISSFFAATAQTVLTQWNFNTAPASTPSTGTGTITGIGGITTSTASGSSSSDPTQPGLGFQTTNFPAATAANKTAGVEVAVNTTGFGGISLRFDIRLSNTAANTYTIQYSTDGTTFVDFATLVPPINGGTIVFNNNNTYDLSGITALDNNPNVKFRVVSTFSGAGSTYVGNNGTYATNGTVRFDMLTVLRLAVNPITFKSFTGIKNNNGVQLKWTTSQESNMKNYTLEKSTNGINYLPIAVINANNAAENTYQFVDVNVGVGASLYRIKITGNEGKISYSAIVRISGEANDAKLTIYPTVSNAKITADFYAQKSTTASIVIIDAIGKVTNQQTVLVNSGRNNLPIAINNIANGVYRLRIIGDNINYVASFIKN